MQAITKRKYLSFVIVLLLLFSVAIPASAYGQHRRHRRHHHSKTKHIAVGTAVGAVGGALIGGRKGALIGAGAGAGTGYGVYKYKTRKHRRHR